MTTSLCPSILQYICDVAKVAETLPPEVLEKMGAPPKPDVPIIDPKVLADADGLLFGFPTR